MWKGLTFLSLRVRKNCKMMQRVIHNNPALFFFFNLADPVLLCASKVVPLRIELISNPEVKRTGYFSTRA